MKRTLSIFLFASLTSACANQKNPSENKDAGMVDRPDAAAADAGAPVDTGSERDTQDSDTEPVPGLLGDPCWIAVLPSGHPNYGLKDCDPAFQCIGDKDEAWCSESCQLTGTVSDDAAIEGWCCGELGDACAPTKFWMPPTMAGECAPRDIPLGEPCELGGASRCKPVCDGDSEAFRVACASTVEGRYCTHTCARHLDCIEEAAFAEGCCADIMGAQYCQPEIDDACISN